MITGVVRYVTWPKDLVRRYELDDWDVGQYGITLGIGTADQTLIPWANVVDIVTHNTNHKEREWPTV